MPRVSLANRCSLLVALVLAITVPPSPALSAMFVVNSVGDGEDVDPTDDLCDDGTGSCTLRAAITQANSTAGPDLIGFNIPGAGPHSISPSSELPRISDPVVIDGYSQPGSNPNTSPFGQSTNAVLMVELRGGGIGTFVNGFTITETAGGSTIRGLVINQIGIAPVALLSDNNVIEGNFIGTDVTGAAALGNGVGLSFGTSNNRIGGPEPASRNVISGNYGAGVRIEEPGHDNIIEGNFIGTNARGIASLSNQFGGIDMRASHNVVRANLISGNISFSAGGLQLSGSDNVIEGNFIGTIVSGQLGLGNDYSGIYLTGERNRIGGTGPGQGNIIAFNRGPGIRFQNGVANAQNLISRNSFRLNDGLGIDMDRGGLPNDLGDGDIGPNELQNYPFLTLATSSGGALSVSGLLSSRPSTAYVLEFFSNTECDPSGLGEGRTYLGSSSVTTNAAGNGEFVSPINVAVPLGSIITATATDLSGNTSEFSPCISVTAPSAGDHVPVIFAPGNVETAENEAISLPIWASDPDGDPIISLTMSPLPPGATFVPQDENSSGLFDWTPGFDQAGLYDVHVSATSIPRAQPISAPVEASVTVHVTVTNVPRPPVVTAPVGLSVETGSFLTFTVSASDPDGNTLTSLEVANLPTGATFAANEAATTGTFEWTPGIQQAGIYEVIFIAYSAQSFLSGNAFTTITVTHENLPPVADAGGPYSGGPFAPIQFDGTSSYDPEGLFLSFRWDFGDGTDTNPNPITDHFYSSFGVFQVTLMVSDGALTDTDTTTATIGSSLQARAFMANPNRSIALSRSAPTVCVQLEPVNGSYQNGDIILSTIQMVSEGTGFVSRIPAFYDKPNILGDSDNNGIEEITACFRREDMRLLFSNLEGRRTVTPTIEAQTVYGLLVRAEVEMTIVIPNTPLGVTVTPNPMNPNAVLSFVTTKEGPARVRLFDSAGRLARTLWDGARLSSGYHELAIDGRGSSGARLASGIYFYSVETADGEARGRFSVLK